jgi:phosphohistidine phosphatase
MFQLILLRHAKAEPGGGGDADHERRLTDRGRRNATVMGRFLERAGLAPDVVVSSTAARARETAELAIEGGGFDVELRETRILYNSSIERTLGVVRTIGDEVETILLVGHEPTWSDLASALIGGGRVRLPTAGLVVLDLAIDSWSEIAPGVATLQGLVTPALVAQALTGRSNR